MLTGVLEEDALVVNPTIIGGGTNYKVGTKVLGEDAKD